ncbi:MAG TPA: hypothetical protein VEB68_08580 [Croceibacterium sp.]|nr:hypothetical protein [Croceibacterium sp.]
MDFPDVVLVLIGVVLLAAGFVVAAMNRRRTHALRDRFAEEYQRVMERHRRR